MSKSALGLSFILIASATLLSACCCPADQAEVDVPKPSKKKAKAKSGGKCPTNFKGQDGTLKCKCDGDEEGSVWGSSIYTTDSNICAAARHVGAIDEDGGKVTVKPAKGCAAYSGTNKNGVRSGSWGAYADSYYFKGHGKGKCSGKSSTDQCFATYKQSPPYLAGETDKTYACTCQGNETGAVWGTDTYTTDSNICAAARHSGVIDDGGGKVKVKGMKGCGKYKGTNKNGVKTGNWGSYDKSFYFTKKGKPSCEG